MNWIKAHRRLLIGGFVVAVLAAIVWFVGPWIGADRPLEPWTARLLVVLGLVAVWVAFELLLRWWARRRERRMQQALAAASKDDAELRRLFDEAMVTLNSRRGPNGRTLLHELPFFLFVGAPGSGKTTAVTNSGLDFPLARGADRVRALDEIGGTRNCKWWFAEQGVIIDTAGRFVSRDSDQAVDRANWMTFLRLLKTHRPSKPINGVVVTVSVLDLLASDAARLEEDADKVLTCIEDLQKELGLQFPVYVMVTKADTVLGFSEFFDSFSREQLEQVWGETFGFDLATRRADDPAQAFAEAFPRLLERINGLLIPRLDEEPDERRRSLMYGFPKRFATLGPLVQRFLELVFRKSTWADGSVPVRGVYFSSGTQTGAPIDVLIEGLLPAGGLSPALSRGAVSKTYFIRRLVTDVIFREAGLAGHDEAREKRRRRLAQAATATVVTLGLAWLGGMAYSAWNNQQGLERADRAAEDAASLLAQAMEMPGDAGLGDLIRALDALRDIAPKVHSPVDEPILGMRFGLYRGLSVEQAVETETYHPALRKALLPRIARRLEAVMSDDRTSPKDLYTPLKAYRMIHAPIKERQDRLKAEWFVAAILDQWRAQSLDPQLRDKGAVHLRALAKLLMNVQAEDLPDYKRDLVTATQRRIIADTDLFRRLAAQLVLAGERKGMGIRLSDNLGLLGEQLMERESRIPLTERVLAGYTADDYRKHIRPELGALIDSAADEDAWVLGTAIKSEPVDRSKLAVAVLRAYFEDAVLRWNTLLADLKLRPIRSMSDTERVARDLGSPDSPLPGLVKVVRDQTSFATGASTGDRPSAASAARDIAESQGSSAVSTFFGGRGAQLLGKVLPSDRIRQEEQRAEDAFAGYRRLAGSANQPGAIEEVAKHFEAMRSDLIAIAKAKSAQQSIGDKVRKSLEDDTIAQKFPAPIAAAITAVAARGAAEARGVQADDFIVSLTNASAHCSRVVPGKYPFVRSAKPEIGAEAFAELFRAAGELDQFYTSRIEPQVVKETSRRWVLRGGSEAPIPIKAGTLEAFRRADTIRRVFIPSGKAGVTATVKLLDAYAPVELTYDGQTVALKPGVELPLVWPAQSQRRLVRLKLGDETVVQLETEWAMLRLLDSGVLDTAASSDKLVVRYATPRGSALMEWRAGTPGLNPLRLDELTGFSCP